MVHTLAEVAATGAAGRRQKQRCRRGRRKSVATELAGSRHKAPGRQQRRHYSCKAGAGSDARPSA